MTSAQAILTGALIIAASIVFVQGVTPAAAQRSGGPYQLMHHSNTSANAGVFRLDTTSGEMTYCYITPNSELVCTKSVR